MGRRIAQRQTSEFIDAMRREGRQREINVHGQSSGGFAKKSYDLDFTEDNRLEWNVANKHVKDVNRLTNWGDKAKAQNQMTHEALAIVGSVHHWCDRMRVQQAIHGYADSLLELLGKLGYVERDGVHRHPERTAIFVGDFIDRGPEIRETLGIVRAMTENGAALAVLGNHEWNALRYHTRDNDGVPLRPNNEKNAKQHGATLDQIAIPAPEEWADWLAWFKTLPLYLDLGGLRVVHAAWCDRSIAEIGERRFVDDDFLIGTGRPHHAGYEAVKTTLAGAELDLPEGVTFIDPKGHAHHDIRARLFGRSDNGEPATLRSLVFPSSEQVPEVAVAPKLLEGLPNYAETEPPVIFGHYWVPPDTAPSCSARNAACVDYSIAKDGGKLVAYRWDGEAELDAAKMVSVGREA